MAAIALLGAPEVSAQGARAHYVNVTTFAHEFSSVLAVRELSDASILVGDRMEKQVIRLTVPSTPGRPVLRKGEGPGEVKDVARFFAALGDTTLVWDSVLRRAVVLVGARVVRTYPTSDGFWRGEVEFPTAVDRDGNVYGLRAKASTVRKGPINPGPLSIDGADSAEVVVFPKGKPPARVLFTTRGAFTPAYMVLKTVDGMPIHYHLRALLDRPDLVAVCADGSMLRASSATGRAWWWRSGTSTALVTSLFARPPVTEARKRQAIVQSLDARLAKFFSPDEYPPWPKLMPAFERDGAWCLPSGDGILEGTPDDVGRRPHYLVSRTGAVSPVAGVPANARIAGVGAREVYFKVESDDGLFRVARFRLVIETGRASGAL